MIKLKKSKKITTLITYNELPQKICGSIKSIAFCSDSSRVIVEIFHPNKNFTDTSNSSNFLEWLSIREVDSFSLLDRMWLLTQVNYLILGQEVNLCCPLGVFIFEFDNCILWVNLCSSLYSSCLWKHYSSGMYI